MNTYMSDDENCDDSKKKPKEPLDQIISRHFLDQRKLSLWGEVKDTNCARLSSQFLYLDSIDPGKEITLYLNTPGGSVTAGMALYDTMKLIKSPIKIVVTGMAASMGSIFVCAGEKGKRFIYPHARILIHQPLISGRFEAPAIDINIHAMEMERQRDELNKILSEASGQPMSRIRKDTDRDFYLNATEAIKYGLADEITETA